VNRVKDKANQNDVTTVDNIDQKQKGRQGTSLDKTNDSGTDIKLSLDEAIKKQVDALGEAVSLGPRLLGRKEEALQ